ncbi:MAG: DUF1326 domain-containing protein [Candidatus Eremiobacteraeota bacterium]|nr:DUF1326 domain-containing protein [Candidatus Eremiobacteraeota bacterium]
MSSVQQPSVSEKSLTERYIYFLQGTLLEACSCDVLCPCWIGENPDTGDCKAFVAYHFDKGEINGVDVSGLSMVNVARIPGNVLTPHTWKLLLLIDDKATDEQVDALLAAYSGKLGGPLADLAQLVSEVVGVERVPISHQVRGGAGTLHAGDYVAAEMEPYRGPDGSPTTLRDSIFSTIPGSPAYVAKAKYHRVDIPNYGIKWEFEGRNAIQGDYTIVHTEP